jgi:hypothetical protein
MLREGDEELGVEEKPLPAAKIAAIPELYQPPTQN